MKVCAIPPYSFSSCVEFHAGANYSAGERQLIALCRALVKNSRIIILVSFSWIVNPPFLQLIISTGRSD